MNVVVDLKPDLLTRIEAHRARLHIRSRVAFIRAAVEQFLNEMPKDGWNVEHQAAECPACASGEHCHAPGLLRVELYWIGRRRVEYWCGCQGCLREQARRTVVGEILQDPLVKEFDRMASGLKEIEDFRPVDTEPPVHLDEYPEQYRESAGGLYEKPENNPEPGSEETIAASPITEWPAPIPAPKGEI